MKFDDALPERFLHVGSDGESHRVRIDRGATQPSPYIVKLTRDTDSIARMSVTEEIEALAKSLIIDGDEDFSQETSVDREEIGLDALDISSQLREFDSALSDFSSVRLQKKTIEPSRPRISLEEALRSLDEPAISLDALVPIESVVITSPEELVAEQMSQRMPSPWVFGSGKADSESSHFGSQFFNFEFRVLQHASLRALAAFTLLSFAIVLPLQAMQTFSGSVQNAANIQDAGTAALDDVARATAALSAKDFGVAQSNFSSAAEKFANAEESLNDVYAGVVALVNVIPQTSRTYASVRGLITAGQELSQTASMMSKAGEGITTQNSTDLVAKLTVLSAYVESALPHVQAAQGALSKVDVEVVPAGYMDKVALLQSQVPEIAESMGEFLKFVDTLTYLLGDSGTMRYLALFQNNTELRPTGGFVGSFAEIDVDRGQIENLVLPGGGTYDMKGQLDAFVGAPDPLSLINPRWEFQDGNWFPDFPTSAKKMQWFYEHAGGPTTDGVIAVNATFMEKILAVVGPVDVPEYGVTVDAENFLFTTEKIVEVDYGTTATPKAFLGDLAPLLLEKIESADTQTLLKVIVAVEQGLAERDIQLYFRDNDAQRAMHDLGYDGAVAQTDGDYLMVVNTNVGGGKTDAVIDQAVDVSVDISETGSIIDTVEVTKTHRGMANALFTGINNVDYLRIYVPEGSVLLSADGFEPPSSNLFPISDIPLSADDDLAIVMSGKTKDTLTGVDIWNEFGKTVFGGWVQTAPGETQTVHFSYRLPQVLFEKDADSSLIAQLRRTLGFDNHDGYSMFVQKQSGVITRETTIKVNTPEAFKTFWTNVTSEDNKTIIADNSRDSFSGWIFTR